MRPDPFLRDGEQVQWEASPRRRRIFRPVDAFIVPVELLMLAALLFMVSVDPSARGALLAFGLTAIGWGLVGQYVAKWVIKGRTRYVVTNLRALVVRSGRLFEAHTLDATMPIVRQGRRIATVYFGDPGPIMLGQVFGSQFSRIPTNNSAMYPSFLLVKRGDGSTFPLAFYDLEPADVQRMVAVLERHRVNSGSAERATVQGPTSQVREESHGGGYISSSPMRKLPFEAQRQYLSAWINESALRYIGVPVVLLFIVGNVIDRVVGTTGFPALLPIIGGSLLGYRWSAKHSGPKR